MPCKWTAGSPDCAQSLGTAGLWPRGPRSDRRLPTAKRVQALFAHTVYCTLYTCACVFGRVLVWQHRPVANEGAVPGRGSRAAVWLARATGHIVDEPPQVPVVPLFHASRQCPRHQPSAIRPGGRDMYCVHMYTCTWLSEIVRLDSWSLEPGAIVCELTYVKSGATKCGGNRTTPLLPP